MAFLIGILVNSILISIPIGATLGTLFGIRPFEGDRAPIPVTPAANDTLLIQSLCDEFHFFAQNKIGQNFTVNSNEFLPAPDSMLCMTMTTFQNSTYPTNSTVPAFSITWEYPFDAANTSSPLNDTKPLIHAFPQATISDLEPLTLENIGELGLDFEWTMGIGDTNSPEANLIRLGADQVNATVALDMYLDADPTNAGNASAAAFEMIIYFAKFGLEDPVGFGNGSIVSTGTLDGINFNLFTGKNDNEQNVFSWVATQPITDFSSDIMPLFNDILNLGSKKNLNVDLPTFSTYLGYVGFGTQAYNSQGNVTFWVPKLSIDVRPFDS